MVKKIEARTDDAPGGKPPESRTENPPPTPPENQGESRTGNGPETAEDMDFLIEEAAGFDQAAQEASASAAAARQKTAQAQALDEMNAAIGEVAGMLAGVRDMAAETVEDANLLPPGRTVAIWSDDRLRKIADPLVKVCALHGEQLAALIASYGPYVMLFAAVVVPAASTVKAVRVHRAEQKPVNDGQQ